MVTKKLHFETLQVHVGQEQADPATDARAVPIYQTTSYVFHDSQHAADRFGLRDAGNIYGRLTNSTQGVFEARVAALEGGVAGLAVASGAAAVTYALQNILGVSDHIVDADNLYGGSFNLITHTLATQGITHTIVNVNDLQALEAAIREKAESAIIEACQEKGLKAKIEYGEAAFYGPKLDFMVKDAIGRRWQLGTIQVDYNLPERFELEYTGEDNKKHRPVMIHRAPFGSMERFVAVLIEHTGGKFPLWLTPDQVAILPISEKFNDYAYEVKRQLEAEELSVLVDDRNEKIGRKIRDTELKRIPYMLIVGEKEAENNEVSVRKQGEGDKGSMKITTFAALLKGEVEDQMNHWKKDNN